MTPLTAPHPGYGPGHDSHMSLSAHFVNGLAENTPGLGNQHKLVFNFHEWLEACT